MRRALMLLILPCAAYAAEPSNPEGFPRGEAGPPTRAATGPANVGPLTIGSELFANYTRRTSGDAVGTGDDRFELSRLHLASRYERGRVTARSSHVPSISGIVSVGTMPARTPNS